MSKFLDKLQNEIHDMNIGYITNNAELFGISHENVNNMVDSLGENARRLLEIGIVQDELVKLGFELEPSINKTCINSMAFKDNPHYNYIRFYAKYAVQAIANKLPERHYYTSPTWQQDLINQVKKLVK